MTLTFEQPKQAQAASQYDGSYIYKKPIQVKHLSFEVWQEAVKGAFVNFAQYQRWVEANNGVAQGFPLEPRNKYKQITSTDQAFGNPPGTYRQWQRENMKANKYWLKANEINRQRGATSRAKRAEEAKKVKEYRTAIRQGLNSPKAIDMSDVCRFLLEKGMIETVYNIRNEKALTLKDSKTIIEALFEHTSRKQAVKA